MHGPLHALTGGDTVSAVDLLSPPGLVGSRGTIGLVLIVFAEAGLLIDVHHSRTRVQVSR